MNNTFTCDAVIKKVADIEAADVEIPFDIREEFWKGRVKVHTTFDGEPYNGRGSTGALSILTPAYAKSSGSAKISAPKSVQGLVNV